MRRNHHPGPAPSGSHQIVLSLVIFLCLVCSSDALASTNNRPQRPHRPPVSSSSASSLCSSSARHSSRSRPMPTSTRSSFFQSLVVLLTAPALVLMQHDDAAHAAEEEEEQSGGLTTSAVFQTNSGLKYIDLKPGSGPSPQYGQLVSIQFTSYIKLPASSSNDPSPKPQQFDHQDAYLFKHGSGRMIAGLDEGLHTLKQGGTRRILIPPKLGYVESGIGPIPEYPWNRWKLNNLLDKMVEVKGGTLVMEVTLLDVLDDEADQGYYQDNSLSPQELEALQRKLQNKQPATAATAAQQQPEVQ